MSAETPSLAQAPSLAIVICTFKRPELLRAALRSVAAQALPPAHGAINVYVVDNSDEGDAQNIVAEEAARPYVRTVKAMAARPTACP